MRGRPPACAARRRCSVCVCVPSRRHGEASRSAAPAHFPWLRADGYPPQTDDPVPHTSSFGLRPAAARAASPERWRSAEPEPAGGFAQAAAPSHGWALPTRGLDSRPSQSGSVTHASEWARPGFSPAADGAGRWAPSAAGIPAGRHSLPDAAYSSPQPLRTSYYAGSVAHTPWATSSGASLLWPGAFAPGGSGVARHLEESAFASAVRESSERR